MALQEEPEPTEIEYVEGLILNAFPYSSPSADNQSNQEQSW